MMWWAIWCAVVVAAGAGASAAPAPDALGPLSPLDLVQIDPPAPDDDSEGYALSPVGRRYASGVGAPWLYYLAEPHDTQVSRGTEGLVRRSRRGFSVNPAVDVLQRLAIAKSLAHVAQDNRKFFDCIGKRDPSRADACDYMKM